MPSRKQSLPIDPADMADIAKANPYVQRLINDADLRDNIRTAIESGRSAFDRLTNGKAPGKALLEDKKLQRDLRQTFESARDAVEALQNAPKRKAAKKGMGIGAKLLIVLAGAGAAMAGSEQLRSKVLDMLFGAEEEFQYTPPSSTGTTNAQSAPVSAA